MLQVGRRQRATHSLGTDLQTLTHGRYTSGSRGQHRVGQGVSEWRRAYVDLTILESLLQVVVDGLVGNLADEGEIRDSDLLLLCRLEGGLLDLGLSTGTAGLRGGGILLSSSAFGYGLRCVGQSIGAGWRLWVGSRSP